MHKGKKYELTGIRSTNRLRVPERTQRIRALRDINNPGMPLIRAGDLGGFVESEENLSQDGECWVAADAVVYGKAKVSDNALVTDEAHVCCAAIVKGNATVSGRAWVGHNAVVDERALVTDEAHVMVFSCIKGDARVEGEAYVIDRVTLTGNAIARGNVEVQGKDIIGGSAITEEGIYYSDPGKKVEGYDLEDVIQDNRACSSCRYCCYCEESRTLRCYHPKEHVRPLDYERFGKDRVRIVCSDVRYHDPCRFHLPRRSTRPIKTIKTYESDINYVTYDSSSLDDYIPRILGIRDYETAKQVFIDVALDFLCDGEAMDYLRINEDKLRNCKNNYVLV